MLDLVIRIVDFGMVFGSLYVIVVFVLGARVCLIDYWSDFGVGICWYYGGLFCWL